MSGPFYALLPHESLVCLEIGDHGSVRQIEFLNHRLVEAEMIDFLCNPAHGLAMRLTQMFRSKARMSCIVDARLFETLVKSELRAKALTNAVVHRTRFLSGASYYFILFNVPPEHIEHSPHLFKLLSSHLKMVLSRVITTQEMQGHVAVTDRELEILRWMADGKSNREIGVGLGISPITVKHHISKIFRKFDVQNRNDAVSRGQAIFAAMRHQQAG
jgi:DNA-binding CsgD family transcriptional regulator